MPLDYDKFPRIRNRKDARAFERVLRKSGKSEEDIKKIIAIAKRLTKGLDSEQEVMSKAYLLEGEKVMLNVNKILASPDWPTRQEAYKDFVLINKNNVFTVMYDENYRHMPRIVRLAEDDSEQRWLFSDNDLLVYDATDGKFKEMWMIEVEKAPEANADS